MKIISLIRKYSSCVWLLVLIAPFILLAPLLFTARTMFWGTSSLQFVPWRHFAWETIREGILPLWNPLVGMGAPLLANHQSALLYPPNWLLFLLDEIGGVAWAAWGQGLLVALHLAWAGAGLYILGSRLGLSDLAKSIAGLAFGLSGYLVARSGFLSINSAVAWLPWVLVYSVSTGNRIKIFHQQTTKLAIVISLQLLSGHAQTSWYTILLAIMWSGMWNWHTAHSRNAKNDKWWSLMIVLKRVLHEWGRLGLAIGAALMLSAIQWIPTGEYLLQSQRSNAVEYDFAMTYSFWPWRILTLLAPGMFGSPVSGDYWGYGNYWEDAIYVGLLPFLLGISILVKTAKNMFKLRDSERPGIDTGELIKEKSPRFLLLLILVSLVLALGERTPVYPWLYKHIPTVAMFQAPTRLSIWAVFAFALLAAIGVDSWQRPTGRGLYWSRLGTAGSFAITLGAGLTWLFLGEVSPTFIRATALTGLFGMGAGILTLTAPSNEASHAYKYNNRKRVWEWGVAAFVMADLLIVNWGLIPGVEQNFYTLPLESHNPGLNPSQEGRIFIPESDEYALKFERFFRFDNFEIEEDWLNLREVMLPNINMLADIPSANNFDPLVPGRYNRWMEALNQNTRQNDQAKYEMLLNLMAVSVVEIMDHSDPLGVSFHERSGMARARWVPCGQPASSEEIAEHLIFNELVNHDLEVVLELDSQALIPVCSKNEVPESRVEIASETPNQIEIFAETAVEGWLVLADVWYPGWRAYLDNDQVSIYRANYLFRAVQLPAGVHRVSFVYDPLSFRIGALASMIAWIAIAASGIGLRRGDD